MGLFRKKPTVDPVDLLVLQNEIVHLKERLDAAEQAKVILEDQLGSLAATTMVLTNNSRSESNDIVEKIEAIEQRIGATETVGSRVDELQQRVMDVENRRPTDATPGSASPADQQLLAQLSERVEQVAQLAMAPAQPDEVLAARLIELERSATSVEALNRQLAVLTSTVSSQQAAVEQLAALAARVDDLQAASEATDELRTRLEQVAAATTANSERLVQMGTELANQLGELSSELDAVGERTANGGGVSDEVVETLRVGQVRLAAEQARHEIAFREDLATIAEQLRRLNSH